MSKKWYEHASAASDRLQELAFAFAQRKSCARSVRFEPEKTPHINPVPGLHNGLRSRVELPSSADTCVQDGHGWQMVLCTEYREQKVISKHWKKNVVSRPHHETLMGAVRIAF